MQEFEQIVNTAYWILLALILFIIVSRFIFFQRSKAKRISIQEEKLGFRILRYGTLLSIPLFCIGAIAFIFVLQKGNLFAVPWMKIALLSFSGIYLGTELFYNLRVLPDRNSRILNSSYFVFTAFVGIFLLNQYRSAKEHPAIDASIVIDLPIKGKWITTGAGASGLTNHHDRIASQKYAIDIARIGENGKLFHGDGLFKEESNTYGAEVYAPVKGEVVWLVDSLADEPTRDRDNLAGNHVVIKYQDSLFIALAHLQPKSTPAKVGESVRVGDLVGKVGMSGNTDFCHLHIHIQDRPEYDIENGKTFPIRFKELRRNRFNIWRKVKNEYLLSNDIVESLN